MKERDVFLGKLIFYRGKKMSQTNEKMNKYLEMNFVKSSENSYLLDQKRMEPFKISNEELAEGVYFWDPVLRQFIKFGR